jgi:hypothetical protein
MIVRVALYVIASWLIAAHFLRAGDYILVALCVAAPALFFVRRPWSLPVLQGLSYVAAIIWLFTAWHIAQERQLGGEPWLRAAIILGGVAASTVLTGLLLNSESLRARYRSGE